jgi:iron(III) transport system substrate-binding protein
MRNRPLIRTLVVAVCVLSLAACGGSPTSKGSSSGDKGAVSKQEAAAKKVYDQINGLSGKERTDKLVELAEEEGELSIYTSNTDIEDMISAFEDTYDIDVSVYRGNSESVLQRVLQEQKAKFFGNDILETNALELGVSSKEGFLYPYESELREKARDEAKGDKWTGTRFNVFVVGWNTKLVKKDDEPKSFEELADPKWKGKVSMELGDVDWFTAMYDYYLAHGKSEAEVKDLFTKVAANSKVAKGHTVQGELLSAGQFGVTVSSYSHTIDKAAREGAPVTWRPEGREPVQPLVVRPNGIAMMKNAKNPAAAMLFVDFELTEGQKIFENDFRIGSVPTGKDPLEGLEVITVPEKKLLDDPTTWDELYADIVQAGQQLGDG